MHQPHNIAGVKAAQNAFANAVQVGCFDTAFHRTQPWLSDTFALPLEYYERGVRSYGFHGTSYDYVTRHLRDTTPNGISGRTIIAHLGNGASTCALKNGKAVGSSMGFTALDGLAMGTRCGRIDPGVLLYLLETEGMDVGDLTDLLYRKSGLLGLSGLSNDMRELEESDLAEAKGAIDYFIHSILSEIGSQMMQLQGLDSLIFCAGIGENSRLVRRRVCEGLEWCGVRLDNAKNDANADVISTADSKIEVRIVRTSEEKMIAHYTAELL